MSLSTCTIFLPTNLTIDITVAYKVFESFICDTYFRCLTTDDPLGVFLAPDFHNCYEKIHMDCLSQ